MIPNWFLHNFVDIVSVRSAYIFLEATVTSHTHTHTHTLLECCTLVQFTFVFHARMSINPFVSHLTPIFHNSRRGFAFLVFSFIFFLSFFICLQTFRDALALCSCVCLCLSCFRVSLFPKLICCTSLQNKLVREMYMGYVSPWQGGVKPKRLSYSSIRFMIRFETFISMQKPKWFLNQREQPVGFYEGRAGRGAIIREPQSRMISE